jgi:hypothetical protein
MQRRPRWIVAVTAVAAIGTVGSVAMAASEPRPGKAIQVLTLNRAISETQDVDVGRSGLSLGDQHVYAANLTTTNRSPAGGANLVCTVARLDGEEWQCVMTIRLRGGQIASQGTVPQYPGHRAQLAITGGTGRYTGARGVVDWTNTATLVVRLTRG